MDSHGSNVFDLGLAFTRNDAVQLRFREAGRPGQSFLSSCKPRYLIYAPPDTSGKISCLPTTCLAITHIILIYQYINNKSRVFGPRDISPASLTDPHYCDKFSLMSRKGRPPERILKDPKKRQAWVIYQISLQGRSLAEVARNAGVRRQTLYQAFHRFYPRMEKIIAEALDLEPKALWPERYDANGLPVRRLGRPKKKSTVMTRKNNTTR